MNIYACVRPCLFFPYVGPLYVSFHPSPCIVTVCMRVCEQSECAFLKAEIRIFVQFVLRSYLCLCA